MQSKRLFLYILLFLCTTYLVLISAWTNLNSNTLTAWMESTLNANLPRNYQVDIGMSETHLSGLEIKQVHIQDLATGSRILDIQSIVMSFSCLELLLFQEVDYSVELYGGVIEGEIDLFPQKAIDFIISDLQINRNPVIRKTNLIMSNPIISGEGIYFAGDIPEGEIELIVEDLSLSGKPQHTNIPFELPETVFSLLNGEFKLTGNEANVNLITKGDLSAKIEGKIMVNHLKPVNSEFNLNLTGNLTSEFESKLGFFKRLLVNYKNAAGQVSINLSGNLQRPRVKKN